MFNCYSGLSSASLEIKESENGPSGKPALLLENIVLVSIRFFSPIFALFHGFLVIDSINLLRKVLINYVTFATISYFTETPFFC